MKYNEHTVDELYHENLLAAEQLLASLPVAEGRRLTTKGLNGWVYEQTIRYCLSQELTALGISPNITEQVRLFGKVKIDLLIGRVAVEIKAKGFISNEAPKYSDYRTKMLEKGWAYCYLTRGENHRPYRLTAESAFGKERAFFLDTKGDWERFVLEILKNCKAKP